jgi:hypothetical protein
MSETKVRVTLSIPEELYTRYEERAKERKVSIERELLERLQRCHTHTAGRPLYFNDAERGELEHVTGGWALETAAAAISRIKQLVRVAIGEVKVDLDDRVLQRAGHRAKAQKQDIGVWITREVTEGLERSVGLRP